MTKIRSEGWGITTNLTELKSVIKENTKDNCMPTNQNTK